MTNEKIRIQDDLYKFINQEWIDKAVIPDDKPMIGGFNDLNKQVEETLINELNQMSSGEIECSDNNNWLK